MVHFYNYVTKASSLRPSCVAVFLLLDHSCQENIKSIKTGGEVCSAIMYVWASAISFMTSTFIKLTRTLRDYQSEKQGQKYPFFSHCDGMNVLLQKGDKLSKFLRPYIIDSISGSFGSVFDCSLKITRRLVSLKKPVMTLFKVRPFYMGMIA